MLRKLNLIQPENYLNISKNVSDVYLGSNEL